MYTVEILSEHITTLLTYDINPRSAVNDSEVITIQKADPGISAPAPGTHGSIEVC